MNATDDLTLDELRTFHRVTTEADALLETCVMARLSLAATLHRFLPALMHWLGATGVALWTQDEHQVEVPHVAGDATLVLAQGRPLGSGVRRLDDVTPQQTLVWQTLCVSTLEVGHVMAVLPGDHTHNTRKLQLILDAACEELDAILAVIHAAALKHAVILQVDQQLLHPVFHAGLDAAVATIHRELGLPHFALLHRDDVDAGRLLYRVYECGQLVHASDANPHAGLDAAITRDPRALLDPDRQELRRALEFPRCVESMLVSGHTRSEWLGKVICSAGAHGVSIYARDVVEVMCEAISQRLVDFNRERRHLAQFFSPRIITELLREHDYAERHLAPREDVVAILYADINSFTKICEQVLEGPRAIAAFVDRWSAGAVQILWDHGGVFDKMVGDCVIGYFGPPFFRDAHADRALAALQAAAAIQAFTRQLGDETLGARIDAAGISHGLGVAVGVNLCPLAVGILGPNLDYTGFSSGMNATARLQSLGTFRETLCMESLYDALAARPEGLPRGMTFSDVVETGVKNVARPLAHRRVTFTDS